MIASRVSAAALLLAAVLCPAAPRAQTSPEPVDLTPQIILPQPGGVGQGAVGQQQASPVTGAGTEGIVVNRLEAVSAESLGVLNEQGGGLGRDMWAGTARGLVAALLPRLPAETDSTVMRDLMRRLLLTAATAPQGPGEGESLLAMRLERLAAMGDSRGVAALLGAVPARDLDHRMAQVGVDGLLLAGETGAACDQARGLIRESDALYWQKVFIFCQALAGDGTGAAIGLSLLREDGHDLEDEAFFILAQKLTDVPDAALASLPEPTPLHLAMLRAALAPPPTDALATTEPAVLRGIALSADADPEVRLAAAERAEAAGALSAAELGALYDAIPFTEDELANALTIAEQSYGARARAILHQAARRHSVPTARAAVLQLGWSLARKAGVYGTSVRVGLPLLREMAPAIELSWFARDAARALFLTEMHEQALAWFELLRKQSVVNPRAADATIALWPIARLANPGGRVPWDAGLLEAWWNTRKDEGVGIEARAGLLYSLLAAFGDQVAPAAWQVILDGPLHEQTVVPAPAVWSLLTNASRAGRGGETVLLALLALGEAGPARADPLVLAAVLPALSAVGLEREARALAIEAAIARGF